MFLKNKITSFNLESVPKTFKRGWELRHTGGHHSLEDLQASCRRFASNYLFCFILSMATVAVVGFFVCHGNLNIQWWTGLLVSVFVSWIVWNLILYVLPLTRFVLMHQFIGEYVKLMHLLNQEWGYPFVTPMASPGALVTFENTEPFVREKLVKLANQIKALENPKADWGGCLGGSPTPQQLRKEFGRLFDILKPFGLVYPSYDPYFDPEGAYMYA